MRDKIENLLLNPKKLPFKVYIYCIAFMVVAAYIFFSLIGLDNQLRGLLEKNHLLAALIVVSFFISIIILPNNYLRWSIKAIGFVAVGIWLLIFAIYSLLTFAIVILGQTNYIATLLCYIIMIGWLFEGMWIILTELKILDVRRKFILLSVWFITAIFIAALFYGILLYRCDGKQIVGWSDLIHATMYGLYDMAGQHFKPELNVSVPFWFIYANRFTWFIITSIYISFIVEILHSTISKDG